MIAAAVQRYQFACEQFNTKSGSYHQHYMTHVQEAKGVYLVYLYSDKVEDAMKNIERVQSSERVLSYFFSLS